MEEWAREKWARFLVIHERSLPPGLIRTAVLASSAIVVLLFVITLALTLRQSSLPLATGVFVCVSPILWGLLIFAILWEAKRRWGLAGSAYAAMVAESAAGEDGEELQVNLDHD